MHRLADAPAGWIEADAGIIPRTLRRCRHNPRSRLLNGAPEPSKGSQLKEDAFDPKSRCKAPKPCGETTRFNRAIEPDRKRESPRIAGQDPADDRPNRLARRTRSSLGRIARFHRPVPALCYARRDRDRPWSQHTYHAVRAGRPTRMPSSVPLTPLPLAPLPRNRHRPRTRSVATPRSHLDCRNVLILIVAGHSATGSKSRSSRIRNQPVLWGRRSLCD